MSGYPKLLPDIGTGISDNKAVTPPPIPQQPMPEAQNAPIEQPADIYALRQNVIRMVQGGKAMDEIATVLSNSGIKNAIQAEVTLSPELNKNVIRYFLSQTDNNVTKAIKLAKKYGYKV